VRGPVSRSGDDGRFGPVARRHRSDRSVGGWLYLTEEVGKASGVVRPRPEVQHLDAVGFLHGCHGNACLAFSPVVRSVEAIYWLDRWDGMGYWTGPTSYVADDGREYLGPAALVNSGLDERRAQALANLWGQPPP